MAAVPAPDSLLEAIKAADEASIKIEMMDGITIWEALPSPRHQRLVVAILNSVHRPDGSGADCGCFALTDVAVRFENGSFKRPDISIFCTQPPDTDEATEVIPRAVVEVVSKGYEAKDIQFGLPFYLSHGVGDVVIYDPATRIVIHATSKQRRELAAPCTIDLLCGCRCQIPL